MIRIGQLIALLGAGSLIAACFFPIITGPGLSVTFFDQVPALIEGIPANALRYLGALLIGMAVVGVVLALFGKTSYNWIPGIAAAAGLACADWMMEVKLNELKAATGIKDDDLFGGLLKGVSNVILNQITVTGTGWMLGGIGATLIILSSLNFFTKNRTN